MLPSIHGLLGVASTLLLAVPSVAQTYTNCNPLTQQGCPADSALGKTVNIDFTQGASDSFTPQSNPTYGSNGVGFSVRQSGDSPQLTSRWYIMFGRVSVTMKAAPGVGIVSSVVLQSDCLDEIDWEWLGADASQVQTNYFGKGITGSYNRGAFHPDAGSQSEFKTYTIDWSAEQIVWQIDGVTVRAITPSDAAAGQYPQTPCQVKLGAWSAGDPSNSQGTITWAGGNTDYSAGPYTMEVKSITVEDYSSGTEYVYSDQSGSWRGISAVGGSVHSGGGSSGTGSAAPAVTSVSSGGPIPFQSADRSVYPWVPLASTMSTATAAASVYPGLPSGWTVTDSGKVVPPSAAPSTYPPASSTSSPLPSPWAPDSEAGYDIVQVYTTITYEPRSYTPPSSPTAVAVAGANFYPVSGNSSSSSGATSPSTFATSTTTAAVPPPSSSSSSSSLSNGSTPSTPAVPVQVTESLASLCISPLYPSALLALAALAAVYML